MYTVTALVLSLMFLGHIYDENSGARKFLLKAYAWKEVELLRVLFYFAHHRIMKRAWFRKPFYYLFAHFLGTRGVVCQAATLKETEAFIDSLPDLHAIAVGPCRCRVGNRNCGHEIMTDIVIKETSGIWHEDLFPGDYRVITKKEAKVICRRSRGEGMIQAIDRHMYFRGSANHFVICNCCKESCVPLIAYRTFKDEPYSWLAPRSVVSIDTGKCKGCGKCIEVCPFEERTLVRVKGKTAASVEHCMGCGLCVDACTQRANRMVPNPAAVPL